MEKLGTNTLDNPHETQKIFRNTKPDREQGLNYSKENPAHNQMSSPHSLDGWGGQDQTAVGNSTHQIWKELVSTLPKDF